MTENEKTLGEWLRKAENEYGLPLRTTEYEAVANALADEAVRRWLRDLPPGDEGLAIAGREACHAVDSARCAAPWNMMGNVARAAELSYVAAVLAVNTQRLRDSFKGEPPWKTIKSAMTWSSCWDDAGIRAACSRAASAILYRVRSEGWRSPEEAERLLDEVGAWHDAHDDLVDEVTKLKAENERLKQEADSRLCASCLEHHPVGSPCPPSATRRGGVWRNARSGWLK